jgi:hypothetical protein
MIEYKNYPRWLFRGKWVSPTKYVGAVLPGILATALERLSLLEKLSYSDIIRLALWDFLRKHKEATKGLSVFEIDDEGNIEN